MILNNTGGANNPGGINNYAGTATIEDSTISGNSAGSSSVGGIFNNGTLTVEHDSIITENTGSADYVGGLDNDGTATVEDSAISDNGGAGSGGLLNFGSGELTVENSTISGNNGATGYVGGLFNASGGTATVEDSTISGSTGSGGAIYSEGPLTVVASTISGNSGGPFAGGINNYSTATIEASTITGNSSTSVVGGIYNHGTLTLAADIVAKQAAGTDCYNTGGTVDAGYNVDDDGTCALSAIGDVSGSGAIDDYLGTLGLYDGPTETVPLLAVPSTPTGSADPAVGVIPASFDLPMAVNGVLLACSVPDQRGVTRDPPCDIGAFDLNTFAVTYNYEGGTGTPASATSPVGGSALTLPTPTRAGGYSFAGWYSAAEGGALVGIGGASYSPTAS